MRYQKKSLVISLTAIIFMLGTLAIYYETQTKGNILDPEGKKHGTDNLISVHPTLGKKQKQQLQDGINTVVKHKVFNIAVGNSYFSPDKITVNKDDIVTVVLLNAGSPSNFVIKELHVFSPVVRPGGLTSITFRAATVGTFTYTSDISSQQKQNIHGILVVK